MPRDSTNSGRWCERLQRRAETNQSAARISAAELTLRWPHGVQTLVDCTAQLDPGESGWMASVAFRLAGGDPESPAQLGLRHSAAGDADSTTTLKLDTGSAPLPCSLLAALVHCENWLGPNSTFQGTVRAEETSAGRQIELIGSVRRNRFAIGRGRSFSASPDGRPAV